MGNASVRIKGVYVAKNKASVQGRCRSAVSMLFKMIFSGVFTKVACRGNAYSKVNESHINKKEYRTIAVRFVRCEAT